MTRPTARVLSLLELLQGGGLHTVAALADRLGVDERTVRRYATHLADLGIPVEARRGRYGGYRLAPSYKLPPLMLTDDEAIAVVLGLVAGRRLGLVTDALASADSALAKVRRVLPPTLGRRLESLLSTLEVTTPERSAAPPGSGVLLELAEAARDRRTVAIEYASRHGRTRARNLDAYGLVLHGGRWYVTGHDHRSDEMRTFRLDRIEQVRPGEGRFDVPAGFEPAAHVMAGIAAVPWAHEVSVVLHGPIDEVRRRVPPVVGVLTETASGVRLSARAERLAGMAQLLAGLGWAFTVERPDELRDEVRRLADRLRDDAARA
jgi:predicted DNA-binding transcriptional regulator YafY